MDPLRWVWVREFAPPPAASHSFHPPPSPATLSLLAPRLARAALSDELPGEWLAALAAVPAAALAIEYAEACMGGADATPPASTDGDALLAFEAAPTRAARAAVAAAELRRLVEEAPRTTPSPLFVCRALEGELAAALSAALAAGGSAVLPGPAAAALLGCGGPVPALAAALAVNVPGALHAVCAALVAEGATLDDDGPAGQALTTIAAAGPAAVGAVADAALGAGTTPAAARLALAVAAGSPDDAGALVRRVGGGQPGPRAALAAALGGGESSGGGGTSPAARFTAAWAAAVAARAAAPWTHTDAADLVATAALLGAGAAPRPAVAAAWAARLRAVAGGGNPPLDAASTLAGTAAALLLAPALTAPDMQAIMAALLGPPSPSPARAWVAVHLLTRRWGTLAAGLRATALPPGTAVRFPDAGLDAAAAGVVSALGGTGDWAAALTAAADAAAAMTPTAGLAAGVPPADARPAEAVDAVVASPAALARLDEGVRARLGVATAAHLRAAGVPLHPALVALAAAAAAAGPDFLPPDAVDACLAEPALSAAERGVSGAAPLASLYVLERNAAPPQASAAALPPVWPHPLEGRLPLARLARVVAGAGGGGFCSSIRPRWMALAADVSPGAVAAALEEVGGDGGSGGGGVDPALEAAAAAALHGAGAQAPPPPTCAAGAALLLRTAVASGAAAWARPHDVDLTAATVLPWLCAPTCPPSAADDLARWLTALPPDAARLACARVLLALGCGGGASMLGDGPSSSLADDQPPPAVVAAFAADLTVAPLLALAPDSAVWGRPPLARACLAAALRCLDDARRAARVLAAGNGGGGGQANNNASTTVPLPGGTPSGAGAAASSSLLPSGRELESALTAQDGAAAMLLVEALDGAWRRARDGDDIVSAAAAETGAALAEALHALFLASPGAARVLHWQGYPPHLADVIVAAVPSAHIASGWAAGLASAPGAGGLGPALAGALAATHPTPATCAAAQAALARGRAAVAAGDVAAVAASLAAGARAAAVLPALAPAVAHLAQSAADAAGVGCCAAGDRPPHAAALADSAAAALAELTRALVAPGAPPPPVL